MSDQIIYIYILKQVETGQRSPCPLLEMKRGKTSDGRGERERERERAQLTANSVGT